MDGGLPQGHGEAFGRHPGGASGGGAILCTEARFGWRDGLLYCQGVCAAVHYWVCPGVHFTRDNSIWIILVYMFMVSVAGYTAGQRAKHVPRGKYVAGASILVGTSITMFLLILLSVFPFTPRYIIPVAGMMVGNAMRVTQVTMKRLRDDIQTQLNLVETALPLGATPRQETVQQVKRALVISLSPGLDNAKTVGLISLLPGAMTGLIMRGASPLEAIQLQIVVMTFLIGASTISSILSTYLCWPGFFTKAHQLETRVFFTG